MGSPGVVEGTQTIRYYWLALSWPWLLQPPRPNLRPLLLPRLMLIPGMDTTATPGLMPMVMDTGLMAMDTTDTERGLPMLSPLLRLMLPLRLRLIPGTDTMDMGMERGLPMLSPLLRLPLPLRLRLIPGTDTMDMASTDLMAMDTMDTGLMAMDTTTERGLLMLSLKQLLLLMLLLPLMLMPGMDTMAMVCTDPMAMDTGERSKKVPLQGACLCVCICPQREVNRRAGYRGGGQEDHQQGQHRLLLHRGVLLLSPCLQGHSCRFRGRRLLLPGWLGGKGRIHLQGLEHGQGGLDGKAMIGSSMGFLLSPLLDTTSPASATFNCYYQCWHQSFPLVLLRD